MAFGAYQQGLGGYNHYPQQSPYGLSSWTGGALQAVQMDNNYFLDPATYTWVKRDTITRGSISCADQIEAPLCISKEADEFTWLRNRVKEILWN